MGKRKGRLDSALPNVVVPESNTLQFSFKHLNTKSDKFPIRGCPEEFWPALIEKLHEYSRMQVDEFTNQNHLEKRHVITFDETTEPEGFHISIQSKWAIPWCHGSSASALRNGV